MTMDLYFCDGLNQIYNGRFNLDAMYEHITDSGLIRCCNDSIYIYYKNEGRYIKIDKQNEWHVISRLFSEKIRKTILPKQVNELISRVKNTADIQIHIDEFNKYENMINIRSGVLEYETLRLYEKSPKYMFTYCLNVEYTVSEKMPYFNYFCKTSLEGDEKKKELLLQIIGYLCTPLITAKKCFVFLGAPNSGKSMMLHLIESIFGEELISNIQLENLSGRFSAGILSTKRLNVCAELSARPLKNIEMFKLIVGGDTLSGEYKGKDVFRFKNKCKLLYAGNMLPPIKNEDITTAFIDRLTVLRFNCSIPKNKRINNLDELLIKEIDSIFSETIRTVSKLINNGCEFIEPNDTAELMKDYSFQQNNIDIFVDEWCDVGESLRVHSAVLYNAYKKFCTENAINAISQNLFSQKINTVKGVTNGRFRLNGGNPIRGFYGINIKEMYVQDSEK